MGEKKELFLTVEYQLVCMEEMMELETHYFAAIIVIIDLGKNHQWMLKLVSEGLMSKTFI